MRMLLNIRIPHEPFNTLVRDGSVGDVIGRILKRSSRRPCISRSRTAGAERS